MPAIEERVKSLGVVLPPAAEVGCSSLPRGVMVAEGVFELRG